MALVLMDGLVASLSPPRVERANIGIEAGRVAWIGTQGPAAGDIVTDCAGMVTMPGNVCGHTHLYSALARGMPGPPRTPLNFLEILELIWWRLDRALDQESIRLSVLSGAIDAVLAGTTTLIDHHASPNAIDGSLEIVADALAEVGVRGVVCYEVTDRNGPDGVQAGLRENERFLRANQRPLVRGMVGAHASFTLEDGTLDSLAALARDLDTGVHIHVAEDMADEEDSLRRSGRRTVHRLSEAGVLPEGSIAAHCVHVDQGEIDVLRAGNLWVAHNCRSNLNNGVGRAPLGRLLERAILGTDGIDGDMFAESRTAFFRSREESLDRSAGEFTDMLARAAGHTSSLFGAQLGVLEPGAAADLMVLEYEPPTPFVAENLPWHWAFAFHAGQVRSVMVDGAWVVRNRVLVGVELEQVRAEARSAARKLWERMESL